MENLVKNTVLVGLLCLSSISAWSKFASAEVFLCTRTLMDGSVVESRLQLSDNIVSIERPISGFRIQNAPLKEFSGVLSDEEKAHGRKAFTVIGRDRSYSAEFLFIVESTVDGLHYSCSEAIDSGGSIALGIRKLDWTCRKK